MNYGGHLFMPDDPQTLSRRLAGFVRPIPAKVLAHKLGCTERTAENIRRGHWPQKRSQILKRNSMPDAPAFGWFRKRLRALGLAWRRFRAAVRLTD
jgi:hypothetical protein